MPLNADAAAALLLLKASKVPDILLMQGNDDDGQATIEGIYEAGESGYSPLFERTPGGPLQAIGDLTKLS